MPLVDYVSQVLLDGLVQTELELDNDQIHRTTKEHVMNICENAFTYQCPVWKQPLTAAQHNFEVFLVMAISVRMGPIIGRFIGAEMTPIAPDGGRVKVPLEVRTLLRGLRHRVQFTMEGPRPPDTCGENICGVSLHIITD